MLWIETMEAKRCGGHTQISGMRKVGREVARGGEMQLEPTLTGKAAWEESVDTK